MNDTFVKKGLTSQQFIKESSCTHIKNVCAAGFSSSITIIFFDVAIYGSSLSKLHAIFYKARTKESFSLRGYKPRFCIACTDLIPVTTVMYFFLVNRLEFTLCVTGIACLYVSFYLKPSRCLCLSCFSVFKFISRSVGFKLVNITNGRVFGM